jgi:diaminopimelate decarboxylase
MLHNLPHLTQKDGSLHIEDVDTNQLADEYGTPLYVYSKNRILNNYKRLKDAFAKADVDINIHYAIKANNNLAVLHLLKDAGAGVDASCFNEIELARHAGFPPEKIINTGNNQPEYDLAHALKHVQKINLDDISILPRLLKLGTPDILSFRLNPGVGSGSVSTNVFGGKDSKFGVDAETALKGYQMAKDAGVKKFGIHMMPGTGGMDPDAYPNATKILIHTMEMIAEKTGIQFEFMNIGGGFGIPYKKDESPLDIDAIAKEIADLYQAGLANGKIGTPSLDCEPGRYIAGDSGIMLSRVHTIKESYKRYAGTDGGMNAMMRPALHGAYHEIICANKLDQPDAKEYTYCGPICENGDQYKVPYNLPELEEGDLLAVLNTGAYGYSMSSNYNTQGRPAEVLVDGEQHQLIRKRETLDDIKHLMIVPQ